MSEIFQYVDKNTVLHLLNPLTKVLFCAFIIIAGIMCGDPVILTILLILPIIALMAAGMKNEIAGQFKMLSVVFAFLILITVLTVRSGDMYYISGIPAFTYDGIMLGMIISLRLAAMFFAFMLLVTTTRPGDLVNTLVSRMFFPLDYALMLMITLRFIPTLQIEAKKIREAQAVRGFNAKGISNISRSVGPTITPLLSNSIGRAGSLGHVIELRGYRSGSKIKFTEIPLKSIDMALIAIMAISILAYGFYVFSII
ncbi:energy-coupling factor transporter transmembrane protein EcfT [Methanocella sp. CWC-04]|uniref:Energy-coupling factor transporter transmembrane protein EcfT n=1 Tax=Methanooceanicella nereidis TaxID=2052831 RepID=A0AAP2RFE3_9EURY|nr:energy-coupling factor transporter transmembrane component T [Methanocella sp. CWC-04]MCD1295806.1 energy-coupling factor transporter transmembrane protein EcfT [Methanocella sp. CWC-04]